MQTEGLSSGESDPNDAATGAAGTKKLMRTYGDDLICVRYRYDDELRQRIKTVEIAVDRAKWEVRRSVNPEELVCFRVAEGEDLLRRAVLLAGGRWEEASDLWRLRRREAAALGILPRIVRRLRGSKR